MQLLTPFSIDLVFERNRLGILEIDGFALVDPLVELIRDRFGTLSRALAACDALL
jgi:hypothetical protein